MAGFSWTIQENASDLTITESTVTMTIAETVANIGGNVEALNDLSDVTITTPSNGQVLKYNGSAWVNDAVAGSGTVTSVAMSVPTGLTVAGSPITTTGTFALSYTSGYVGYTTAEQTKLNGIEAAADVTDAANVSAAGAVMESDTTTAAMQFVIDEDSFASNLDTKVPTQQSVKAYADAREVAAKSYADTLVVGLVDDRGNFDASVNTFPASGGSGTAGAILKGDLWTVSVAGTLGGNAVTAGDLVRALVDTPSQTSSNWAVTENNIGYVAENQANKENTTLDTSTTKYPTNRLVKEQLDLKASSIFVDGISGFIETVADKTYKIVIKIPFACTINETVTMCSSGTATATFKINTTALGGTANSVSNSEQTQSHASANSVAAGDDLQITISSNSSCLDMSFTIKITRTI